MEELIKGLAQLGAAGIMSAVNIWVLWYLLTKMFPKMQEDQSKERMKIVESHEHAITGLVATFKETLTAVETRATRDEERCERRHEAMLRIMERCAVKLEEMSYDIDLMKSHILSDNDGGDSFPLNPPKGQGGK